MVLPLPEVHGQRPRRRSGALLNARRCLIVADSPYQAPYLARSLSRAGAATVTAEGRSGALDVLQAEVARLTGHEAGLFMPSGSMTNQVGIALHTRRGEEVVCAEGSHIYEWELGMMATFSGVVPRFVPAPLGVPDPEQVRLAVRGGKRFRVDFFWPQWRLIGEADGFGKYGTEPEEIRRNWAAERRRQAQLEDAGYVVIRWTWADLQDPRAIVRRVREEMWRQERLGLGPNSA